MGLMVEGSEDGLGLCLHDGLPSMAQLLQPAQDKLRLQLLATKQRLEEELREQRYAIKAAEERRLNFGVELYGYQQQLAQVLAGVEQSRSQVLELATRRQKEEPISAKMRHDVEKNAESLEADRADVEAFQKELNDVSNELRLLQQHTEDQQGSVLVQKGAKSAAEQAAEKAASAKKERQQVITRLQGQLTAKHAELADLSTKRAQQEADAVSSRAVLVEVNKDIVTVQAEQRKHLQQWQSSLLKVHKQEATLKETESQCEEVQLQHRSTLSELRSCKTQEHAAAQAVDQAALLAERLRAEAAAAQQSADSLHAQDSALKVTLERFEESLKATEHGLAGVLSDAKALAREKLAAEQALHKAAEGVKAANRDLLEQAGSESSAQGSMRDALKQLALLRSKTAEVEEDVEAAQHAAAATESKVVQTEAECKRKGKALKEAEAELKEREQALAALQGRLDWGTQEVDRKARELDALNRQHQKVMAAVPAGQDAGPLEATISNLKREIGQMSARLAEQQAQWLKQQEGLQAALASRAAAAEKLALAQSTHAVMDHRCARLERQLQGANKDTKDLSACMTRQRADMARLNSALADTTAEKAQLEDDVFTLQGEIEQVTKDGKEEVEDLIKQADKLTAEKQNHLSQSLDIERQMKECKKDMQLQKEMQLALHPEYGQAESAALAKEVSRLRLCLSELQSQQHRLQTDISNAIAKRETSVVKGRAMERLAEDRKGPSSAEHKKRQMLGALAASLQEMEKSIGEADAKVAALKAQQAELDSQAGAVRQHCEELRQEQEEESAAVARLTDSKCQELICTARAQRSAKWYEEAAAGKLSLTEDLERQLKRARAKHERLKDALEGIAESHPEVAQELRRALMHHMSAQAPEQAAAAQPGAQSARTPLTEVADANVSLKSQDSPNTSLSTSEETPAIENMQAC